MKFIRYSAYLYALMFGTLAVIAMKPKDAMGWFFVVLYGIAISLIIIKDKNK